MRFCRNAKNYIELRRIVGFLIHSFHLFIRNADLPKLSRTKSCVARSKNGTSAGLVPYIKTVDGSALGETPDAASGAAVHRSTNLAKEPPQQRKIPPVGWATIKIKLFGAEGGYNKAIEFFFGCRARGNLKLIGW